MDKRRNKPGKPTFTGETASGWQEVSFGAPVPITAGTTYVASYHTSIGYYSEDENYFSSSGYASYYLEALASGVDGPNGVYAASATSTFPSNEYNASNYYVDVVFMTEIGPDTNPPEVVSVNPANGSTSISINANISANFNEALDASTVNSNTVILTDPMVSTVAGTVSYAGNTITFNPDEVLGFNSTYTVTLKGGTGYDRIKDIAGNALVQDYVWTFTTDDPPPIQGPGGPIF